MTHRWSIWFAAFRYFGFVGSRRRCLDCGAVERATLGGFADDRRNRAAAYLRQRLAR